MKGQKKGRRESLKFYATQRHHSAPWILYKIADLVDKGKRLQDSSSILYACFEARNLLELISMAKLQCSVPEDERERITAAAKPLRGIQDVDKELKALRLKTQEFMKAVLEVNNADFPVFKISESEAIQARLSQYVHNYAVSMADMEFGSAYLNAAFPAIDDAVAFAKANLMYDPDRNTYNIGNVDMITLPKWAETILEEWKTGRIKDKAVLKTAIVEAGDKYAADAKANEVG
jgi:hypothetical protein